MRSATRQSARVSLTSDHAFGDRDIGATAVVEVNVKRSAHGRNAGLARIDVKRAAVCSDVT